MPGAVEVGPQRAVARLEHAVEEHPLDPLVIVEVLEMHELRQRSRGVQHGSTGPQCSDSGRSRARQSASTRSSSVMPAQRVTSACWHVDRVGLEHPREVRQVVAVLAGGDLPSRRSAVAHQRAARRDRRADTGSSNQRHRACSAKSSASASACVTV